MCFLGPVLVIIAPSAVPLKSILFGSVRVPQLYELLTLEVFGFENRVSMTLDDSLLVGLGITTFWATGSSKSFNFFERAEAFLKHLFVVFERLKRQLLRETMFNHVSKSHMDLSGLNVRERPVELCVRFFEDSWPHFKAIGTTLSIEEVFILHRKPVIYDDLNEFAVLVELDHEAACLFPELFIAVIGLLADKQVLGPFVTKHTESREEVAVAEIALSNVLVARIISKEYSTWDLTCSHPPSDLPLS